MWISLLNVKPCKARRATEEEKALRANAVVVEGSGNAAVRKAVAANY